MRLEQIQAFLAIAATGSFQQAAHQCNVTQSTISRQIQTLEASLGLPLLHRSAKAKLTVGGERFLPHARRICQEWVAAQEKLTELRDGKQSELCIAAMHSICAHYLPPVLQSFYRIYPTVQLRVTALGSDRALKVLKDGLVDAAIVMNNRLLTISPDMHVQPLFEEPIYLLMAVSHPLAHKDSIGWADLVHYPQVIFKDGYGMQRIVQEQFAQRDIPFRAALELNSPDAFRGVIRSSQMLALLPNSSLIDAYADPTLAIRAITEPLPSSDSSAEVETLSRQVVLVTTCDRLQIPPIQDFCLLASEYIPKQVTQLQPPNQQYDGSPAYSGSSQ